MIFNNEKLEQITQRQNPFHNHAKDSIFNHEKLKQIAQKQCIQKLRT